MGTIIENIPTGLKSLERFVLWRLEVVGRDSRIAKVPYSTRGSKAATNKPATWSAFYTAAAALESQPDFYNGLGIVLGDGIMGIDLDHVIVDEEIIAEAIEIVEEIPGYVEISPSGTGLHILTRAALPADRDRLKFRFVEFYDETSPRYLTLTGNVWEGRGELNEEDASDAVAYIYRRVRERKEDDLLDRIRASKQGEKFCTLYDQGDWKTLGYNSPSEGVAALLAILAFWTKKDMTYMDRLFRASALFNRDKWERKQCGATLGEIEIKKACEFCKDVYEEPVKFPDIGRQGGIKPTLGNLKALLEHHEIIVKYNEIKKELRIRFKDEDNYSVDNRRCAAIAQLISLAEKADLPTVHFRDYVLEIADVNRENPVKDWILSRLWDGVDRLQALCDTVVTKPDYPDDMKEMLITKWLLSCVAAAFHNDESFAARGVLTLAGPQYIGKTRWISSLAPHEWVICGRSLDTGDKDSVRTSISHWICELGELESTLRRDMGRLKSFLSLGQDQFRIPYAADDSTFPRRTVFAASVNEPDFLIDTTGNTRFWVVPVISLDYEHNIDMQQVFAQLHAIGGQWWLTAEENARLESKNEEHEQRDEVYDLMMSKIDWRETEYVDWLTPTDVLIDRCKIDHPTKAQRNSCARILRKLVGEGKHTNYAKRVYPVPR
jgi:putative DNA primase/helicase